MQQPRRIGGHQGGLLGGLGDHRIARHQGRRDLAGEDRQGEVPRAYADEYAAPVQRQAVALPGRSGEGLRPGEVGAPPMGVIAAEINRLADLGEGVGNRLAGFPYGNRHGLGGGLLDQIGRPFQAVGAALRRGRRPGGRGGASQIKRRIGGPVIGLMDMADQAAAVGGITDGTRLAGRRVAGRQGSIQRLGHGPGERLEAGPIGEVDAP